MDKKNENRKIYTKTGDSGQTSLIGGTRVPKYNDRIEAYGTLDELNAHLGVVFDSLDDTNLKDQIQLIIKTIFNIESLIAIDPKSKCHIKINQLETSDILFLESEIDKMNEVLPELTNFILPGGNISASYCHVARCVCRRSERIILRLNACEPVDNTILKYINRLSDYLFVLSRYICFQHLCNEKKWTHEKI